MSAHAAAADRYARMQYRRAGRSGLDLPAISIGGWHNFEGLDFTRRLLCRALDLGVTQIDLANNYGAAVGRPGIAETNSGIVLGGELRAHRDELIVASKAGYDMWPGPYGNFGSRKYLLASLDQSLARLKLDYVDIFYHHRPDPRTPLEETFGALDQAVRSGKALYVGVSNYNADQTRHAASLAREMRLPLIVNQLSYSMLNRGIETNGTLAACGDAGVGLVAFSSLAQGLLSDRYLNDIPADSRAGRGNPFLKPDRVTPALRAKLSALNAIAAARGQSLSGLALTWTLRDPRVTTVLLGASKVEQLEEGLRSIVAAPLSGDELQKIEAVLATA